jgi:hypothetical protein
MSRIGMATVCAVSLFLATALLIACGGGSSATPQTGFVTTSLSDPAPCSAPNGQYSAVWVTVKDVQIHNSSTGQWTDLTPNLAPTQVNLLASANTECFLAMLGSKTELQAGSYEQIRIMLADTNANSVALESPNQCGNAPNAPLNCLMPTAGGMFPLKLASEDKTGIKIPSGQIAGGAFVVAAGQTKDLDIDFDSCASIVATANGDYLLKPVLHAGEVSLNSAVNGKIVDASHSNLPINGGVTIVALEQRINGIDRVLLSTTTDANGGFALCPVPPGTYDLVAVAVDKNGLQYAATVMTGVTAGTVVGNVPLFQTVQTNTGGATISGSVSTSGSGENILVSALQQVNFNGSFSITVPSTAPVAATQNKMASPSANYSVTVPGVNPAITAFGTPVNYAQTKGATYTIDAQPLPLSIQVCSSGAESQSNPIAVNPGDSALNINLSFSGCVAPPQ